MDDWKIEKQKLEKGVAKRNTLFPIKGVSHSVPESISVPPNMLMRSYLPQKSFPVRLWELLHTAGKTS